jgi:hypothetical protein
MQKYNLSVEMENVENDNIKNVIHKLKLIKTSNPNVFKITTQGTSASLITKIIKEEIYNLYPEVGDINIY